MDPQRFDTFVRSLTGCPLYTGHGYSIDLLCCQGNPGVSGEPSHCAAPDARGNGSANDAPQATPVG